MNNPNERLLFLDTETTGTNPENIELLEVACVVTDKDLNEIAAYESVIWRPVGLRDRVSPFIQKMHGPPVSSAFFTPDLLNAVERAQKETSDVEKELLTFFHDAGVRPNKGVLAGFSIHFDRRVLQVNMPLLEAFFYHRMFDVSALKTAVAMWAPGLAHNKSGAHRAMADVRDCIELARYFKDTIFMPGKKAIRLADAACDLLRKSENRDGSAERKLDAALSEYDPNWSTR